MISFIDIRNETLRSLTFRLFHFCNFFNIFRFRQSDWLVHNIFYLAYKIIPSLNEFIRTYRWFLIHFQNRAIIYFSFQFLLELWRQLLNLILQLLQSFLPLSQTWYWVVCFFLNLIINFSQCFNWLYFPFIIL